MSQVQFLYGTKDVYDALSVKNENTLYFLTDTFEIYKGNNLYTRSYEVAESSLDVQTAKENYLYVFKKTGQLAIYNGAYYEYLTPPISTNIATDKEDSIPTVGAVQAIMATLEEAITANSSKIANSDKNIAANAEAIAVLNAGPEVTGSVANTAAAEVAKIVNGAGEGFDTLKDIAEWIASDTTNAQQMAQDIKDLKNTLGSSSSSSGSIGLVQRVTDLEGKSEEILSDLNNTTTTTSTGYRLKEAEKKIAELDARDDTIDITVTPKANESTTLKDQNSIKIGYSDTPGKISVNGIDVLVVNTSDFATSKYVDEKYNNIVTNKLIEYYTKEEINKLGFVTTTVLNSNITAINDRLAANYYTKVEIDELGFVTDTVLNSNITAINNRLAANYYTKVETDQLHSVMQENYASKKDLENYYTKTETEQKVNQTSATIAQNIINNAVVGKYMDANTANDLHLELNTKLQALETAIGQLGSGGSGGVTAKWESLS